MPGRHPDGDPTETIIQMERAALDRWGRGDPSGFLEISAPDVVYFDPFQGRRIDGREAPAQRDRERLSLELHGSVPPHRGPVADHPDALVVHEGGAGVSDGAGRRSVAGRSARA